MTRVFLSKFSWVLCFAWIFALAGFYVFQVTALTQTAFSLGSSERAMKTIQEQVRTLETETGQLRSMEFPALAERLNFEKIQNISYVRLMNQAVAQNTSR